MNTLQSDCFATRMRKLLPMIEAAGHAGALFIVWTIPVFAIKELIMG